jgi:hypothetical protein
MFSCKNKKLTTCTYFATCSLVILMLSEFESVESRLVWIPRLENLEQTTTSYYDPVPTEDENTVRIVISAIHILKYNR